MMFSSGNLNAGSFRHFFLKANKIALYIFCQISEGVLTKFGQGTKNMKFGRHFKIVFFSGIEFLNMPILNNVM